MENFYSYLSYDSSTTCNFQDTKSKTDRPKAIIHDGLQSCNEAFNRDTLLITILELRTLEASQLEMKD